jgi:hypothetical protein
MSTFDLREELEALLDIPAYTIEHEHDVPSMSAREVDDLLRRASFKWLLSGQHV